MKEIENKIDRISDRLSKIEKHIAVYNMELKSHIKRTAILESKVDPLQKLQYKFAGALGLLSFLAILLTIVEIILKLPTLN
jgi:hypothetical protein